ncbi:hypothetical protein BG004_004251 [Podila humilis]|nr:hypothetical protein BG004_004251 [Podila humilis]
MKFNIYVAVAALAAVMTVSAAPTGTNAQAEEVQELASRAAAKCCRYSTGEWCGASGCCLWRTCVKYAPASGGYCLQYNC